MPPTNIESAWPKYPGYQITATPFDGVGRVRRGDVVLAESDRCLIVAESDHIDQLYFPAEDVRWEHLEASDHTTVCPFKGAASYWSLRSGGDGDATGVDNLAWSYADTFDEVAEIAGYVAFHGDHVQVTVTERWPDDPGDQVTKAFPVWGSNHDLVRLMDVRPDGEHRFVAPTYPDPPYGTFFEHARELEARNVVEGGQLLGDLIVAASKTVPDKRVTSAYAMFLKAAVFDEPIEIDVDPLREGRSVAAVEARLNQAGSLRCAGMALLDAGSDDVLRSAAQMPDVPGPDDSPVLDMPVLGRDLREVRGSYLRERERPGPPEVHVWARFRQAPEQQYLQQALLAQATTHWTIAAGMRPHETMTEAEAHVTVSTGPLSVSIAFHDEIDVTQWMLYSNPAIYAGRGSVQGDGWIHAIDGRLVASYTVQAMVRPFAVRPDSVGGYRSAM